jgi:hypothetical protein
VSAAAAMAVTLAGPAGLAGAAPSGSPAGTISTVAGGFGGPGPATAVSLEQSSGCFGMQVAGGRLYVNGDGAERAVNVRTGFLRTLAEQLVPTGFSGEAGPTGLFGSGPCAATADSFGNLILAESGLTVVAAKSGTFYGQKMTAGNVYRLMRAGTCSAGSCAVDVVVDHWGNVIASFSSGGGKPAGINVAPARPGTYYGVHMKVGHTYRLVSGGGAQVAPDRGGNLLVAGDGPDRVGVIAGTTSHLYGRKMTAGKLYNIAGTGIAGFSGDAGSAAKAKLSAPDGVAVDGAGNVVIGDTGNKRIRVVAERSGRFYGLTMKAGDIYTVIGDASPALRALPVAATAVAVDGSGNLLNFDGTLVRALAAKAGKFYGELMRAGHIYTVAGNNSGHPGDGGPATSAQFQYLYGLAIDGAGNIVQCTDSRVRVIAMKTGTFYGQKMTSGDVYTVAGDGSGFSGDGGPALKAEMTPVAVAIDRAGNLVLADERNNRVRVVAAKSGTFYGQKMTSGDIYTIAGDGTGGDSGNGGPAADASVPFPDGLTIDAAGNLVIAEAINGLIRVVAVKDGTFYGQSMTAGDVYTVAGGGQDFDLGIPALQAELRLPIGVTTDKNGNLVIAESLDGTVQVVAVSDGTFYGQNMTAGDIYTVLFGLGSTDEFGTFGPTGVTVDGAGNLLIADPLRDAVWLVAATSGTFYGVKATAGQRYEIAGGGTTALGDGGPGTKAEISPYAIAVDARGNLVITDQGNGRIRILTP